MTIKPRSAWGARPPRSVTRLATSSLEGFAAHWFGSPRAPSSQAGMPALLRGVQNGHMAPGGLGAASGGSDIGYSFIIDLWGGIWEGRGWDVRPGATGPANGTHLAIAYAAGPGDPFTKEAQAAFVWLTAEARRRGMGTDAAWHSMFMTTTCPGDTIRAWIRSGGHVSVPDLPKEDNVYPWLSEWLPWYIFDRRDETRPKDAPTKIPQDAWALVGTITNIMRRQGAHPQFRKWAHYWFVGRFKGEEKPANLPNQVFPEWWTAASDVHQLAEGYAARPAVHAQFTAPLRAQLAELEEEIARLRKLEELPEAIEKLEQLRAKIAAALAEYEREEG